MGFATLFAAALGWILIWLRPEVPWGDPHEVVAAAYTLGVIHPPGSPPALLAGKALALLPLGSVTTRVNLLSAIGGAGLICVLFAFLTALLRRTAARGTATPPHAALRVAVALTALVPLLQPHLLWISGYAEVTPLQFALLYAVLAAACTDRSEPRRLASTGALAGLLAAVKLEFALFLPPAVAVLALRRRRTLPKRAWLVAVGCGAVAASSYLGQVWMARSSPAVNFGNPAAFSNLLPGLVRQRLHVEESHPTDRGFLGLKKGGWISSAMKKVEPYITHLDIGSLKQALREGFDKEDRKPPPLPPSPPAGPSRRLPALEEFIPRDVIEAKAIAEPAGWWSPKDTLFYKRHLSAHVPPTAWPFAALGFAAWARFHPLGAALFALPAGVFHLSQHKSQSAEQAVYTGAMEWPLLIAACLGIWLTGRWLLSLMRLAGRPVSPLAPAAWAVVWTLILSVSQIFLAQNDRLFMNRTDHFPSLYTECLLGEVQPRGVIVTQGAERLFALWHVQVVEHRRPDVLSVSSNLWATRWYFDEINERTGADAVFLSAYFQGLQPGALLPREKADRSMGLFLDRIARRRPVYFGSLLRRNFAEYRTGSLETPPYLDETPLLAHRTIFERTTGPSDPSAAAPLTPPFGWTTPDPFSRRFLQEWILDHMAYSAHYDLNDRVRFLADRYAAVEPADAYGPYYQAGFLAGDKKPRAALEQLDRAIELDPTLWDAYIKKSYLLGRVRRNREAADTLERLLALNPRYGPAFNNRGNLKLQSRDFAGAEADYFSAIRYAPDNPDHWLNLARLYAYVKEPAKASAVAAYVRARFPGAELRPSP